MSVNEMPPRHVYIIGPPSGPFKIGVATSLKGRLATIQTGSPLRVKVLYSTEVPYPNAGSIEQHAHKLLNAFRLSGEWFNVTVDDAKAAVEAAKAAVDEAAADAEIKQAEKAWMVAEQAARIAAADKAIVRVANVELIHRVTAEEYFAEDARIQRERAASRKATPKAAVANAFSQKMIEGKRKKAAARLATDTAALQAWLAASKLA